MTIPYRAAEATAPTSSACGFTPMGEELPPNFLTFEPRKVCLTIADLFRGSDSQQSNKISQAMVALAHFAAGSMIPYRTAEYRALERKGRAYARVMNRPQYRGMKNLAMARYVLRRARERARQDGLIGRS